MSSSLATLRAVVLALAAGMAGWGAGWTIAPAIGQARHREQDAALAARQSGHALSLHEVEQRIVPKMPGCDYLGPEYDAGSGSYRLKFMRGGSLLWVDVDARTGAIVGRSGG